MDYQNFDDMFDWSEKAYVLLDWLEKRGCSVQFEPVRRRKYYLNIAAWGEWTGQISACITANPFRTFASTGKDCESALFAAYRVMQNAEFEDLLRNVPVLEKL